MPDLTKIVCLEKECHHNGNSGGSGSSHTHENKDVLDKTEVPYTAEEQKKLAGLSNYTHPTHTPHNKGFYKFANDGLGHVLDAEKVTKADIMELGIPGEDTTYTGGATDYGTISTEGYIIIISKAVGMSTAGKTYTIDDTEVTAYKGAEIFNDYGNNIASGNFSHAEGGSTTASGDRSHAEGGGTKASGGSSHAEGSGTEASGSFSHAEGELTTASGDWSHAEGYETIASGARSHAEGSRTKASGGESHAEGYYSTASGSCSHAEGYYTTASGLTSHAEGDRTTASGDYSHAEGERTTAASDFQHVQGKYNIKDADGIYAFIIGNGYVDSEGIAHYSNAVSIDWDGNIFCYGDTTSLNAQIDANTKKLSGIADNANNYVHPTTSGNKHIPSGGSSGQILRWSADGTAVWGKDNNTTYTAGTGLSMSGTTINHSNSVTAKTTTDLIKIKHDAQGHITGTADVAASDVSALINKLTTAGSTPTDADYYVSQYAGGGTTTTTYHRRPMSALWEYIKSKISSVLGLTASTYGGKSATATKLATARTINGVSFDGSANITIPRSSLSVHSAGGTSGSTGYVKIATFKIAKVYQNSVVTIEYARRAVGITRLHIRWNNANSTDPTLASFLYESPSNYSNSAYLYKSATSTWDLYIAKTEAYDTICITDCKKPSQLSGITVAWTDVQASSLPSGYVSATKFDTCHVHSNKSLLDGYTDSGWITLTGNVKYRKIGNIVEVRGTYTAPSSGGGLTIGTLPAGYRPSNAAVYNTNSINGTAANIYYTSVSTTGTLVISSMSGSAFTQGTAYNVNIMFMVD